MSRQQPISLWDSSAEEEELTDPFEGGGEPVDVAIVGGGYTGLSAALHCAERGLGVHLIEAEQIGYGGSGRNVGLVNAGTWLAPGQVQRQLGETHGRRFVARFSRAPDYVFSLIEKHQIRCEATRTGTIHAAHAPGGLRDLRHRAEEWRRLGEPVELLDRDRVAVLTGTAAYFGGLLDHRAGTINPMGYCRGLARAARNAGARISTGVHAMRLERVPNAWNVETSRGPLQARSVILGTNAYTDDLWPDLKRTFTEIRFFQFATKPLGARAKAILPGGQGLWDTAPVMFSMRRDAAGRLIVGSMGSVTGNFERGLSRRFMEKRVARLFPHLGPVEFEEAWDGRIAMTPDHLPRILELAENLYTPIGYNGRGITTGTVFGQAMAELLGGMDRDELPLPVGRLQTVSSAPLMSRFYRAAFAANQFVRGF
jgi:glycine/D-amino acid oxidase-like deaminating enzyme